MSKSRGNVWYIRESVREWGADVIRLTVANAGDGLDDPNVDMDFAESAKARIGEWLRFATAKHASRREHRGIDAWFLSVLNRSIQASRTAMEGMNYKAVLRHGYFDLQAAWSWYVRRSEGRPHADVLRRFIDVQTKLLAPFVPHVVEEIWHRLHGEGFVVDSRYPEAVAGEVDPRAEAAETLLQSTLADVREILKVTGIAPKRLALYTAPAWKIQVPCEALDLDLPGRSGVERESLRSDPGDLQDFPDVGQGRLEKGFGRLGPRVDFARDRFRIPRVDHETLTVEAVPDLLHDVRHERGQQLRLHIDEPSQHVRVGPPFRPPNVPGPSRLQVEIAVTQDRLVVHPLHRGPARLNRTVEDAQEPRVDPTVLPAAGMLRGREPEPFSDAGLRGLREVHVDVRIVEAISGVGDGQADDVGAPLAHRFADIPDVPARLRHLPPRQAHPPVHAEPAGPELLREDGGVSEQAECHVVLDQVFPGVPQVERVPIRELASEVLDHFHVQAQARCDGLRTSAPEEQKIEERVVEALGPRDLGTQVPALKGVGDCVIRHVDRRVAQGLDDPVRIPWENRPQAAVVGARPISKPVGHVVEPLPQRLGVQVHRGNRSVDLRFPRRIGIGEEPLVVHDLHDLGRQAPTDDDATRLVHQVGLAFRRQLLPNFVFGDLHPDAGVGAAVLVQHAAVEAGLVDLGLRLLEFLAVLLVPNPEAIDDLDAGQRPPSRRADDRDRLDRLDPLRVQIVLVQESVVVLQIPQGDVVVRRVRRHARHNPGAAALVDEGARQDRDRPVDRRSHHILAEQIGSPDPRFDRDRLPLLREFLRREVIEDPSLVADPRDHVFRVRIDPEVRLPEHGLGPDRRRDQEPAVGQGELQQRVFRRRLALALESIVVPDRRLVLRAPDDRVLVDPHVAAVLEAVELPAHERVVRRVERRRDEGTRPVDGRPERFQVVHRRGGEDLDPMHRIREFRDLSVGDAHRPEDLPLLRLFLRNPLRGSQDREAGAMEPLRVEDVVAQHPPEPRLELGPEERGAEPQVLVPIHVRVGDRGVPLRPSGVRARDVYVFALPRGLPLGFDLPQVDRSPAAAKLSRRAWASVGPRLPPPRW